MLQNKLARASQLLSLYSRSQKARAGPSAITKSPSALGGQRLQQQKHHNEKPGQKQRVAPCHFLRKAFTSIEDPAQNKIIKNDAWENEDLMNICFEKIKLSYNYNILESFSK